MEYNSADYLHVFITLDEPEKVLKLTKNCKNPGQDIINSELHKYAPEEFKLRLLPFLNNIHTEKITFQMNGEMRGGVVVKALRYKSAGRGFDSR